MTTSRSIIWSVLGFVASISTSYAGPCSDDIDRMQGRIDARLEAKAAAGPSAREGVSAGMGDQPTPGSIAAAEEKLGDVSPQMVEAVGQAMARARAANSAGDKSACEQALSDAQHTLGP